MSANILRIQPPVIAHRGASAYAPENTLAAFVKAAQLNIKWVEFDVAQAACGMPIIFHDELLDRTTDGRGEISQYSFAYLQTLDAGGWFSPAFSGERIPSLLQVMEFLQSMHMSANIEIKCLPREEQSLIKQVLEQTKFFNNGTLLFSSFSMTALKTLRQYAPNCLLGLLLHEWLPDWPDICNELQCVSVHINQEMMTREMAAVIKSMDKVLLCYTVNDPARAKELFSWGVDAVFSDVPDVICGGPLPALTLPVSQGEE